MEKLRVPYSAQVTLVIENYNEIVWFSHAVQSMTYDNLIHQMKVRKKHPAPEPLGFEFEEPVTMDGVDFYPGYPCDIILVDKYTNILSCWTEPDFSELSGCRNSNGVKIMVLCPEGFIHESGIIQGVSKLTLRSSMAWAPIYYQEVWRKGLKTKSDQEIIDIFNSLTGKRYRGYSGTVKMSTLGDEILSRGFDSSIIITLNKYGSLCSTNYSKKVRLIDNKLEFEPE
jgi:hypothetical protein